MANIRLKCADWNISVKYDAQDAYVYQGEIDFTNACTIGGEAAVMSLNMNAGASAITGNLRGLIVNCYGAGLTNASSIGIEVRTDGGSATLDEGIRIWSVGGNSITTGIKMQGTLTTCFDFTSVVTGCDDSDSADSRNGRVLVVDKNGDTKAIYLYDLT